MYPDLQKPIATALKKRKGEWKKIAADLSGRVSYSLISKLGRKKYESEVSLSKLRVLHEYLFSPPEKTSE